MIAIGTLVHREEPIDHELNAGYHVTVPVRGAWPGVEREYASLEGNKHEPSGEKERSYIFDFEDLTVITTLPGISTPQEP